jgi:hypothetical protein
MSPQQWLRRNQHRFRRRDGHHRLQTFGEWQQPNHRREQAKNQQQQPRRCRLLNRTPIDQRRRLDRSQRRHRPTRQLFDQRSFRWLHALAQQLHRREQLRAQIRQPCPDITRHCIVAGPFLGGPHLHHKQRDQADQLRTPRATAATASLGPAAPPSPAAPSHRPRPLAATAAAPAVSLVGAVAVEPAANSRQAARSAPSAPLRERSQPGFASPRAVSHRLAT